MDLLDLHELEPDLFSAAEAPEEGGTMFGGQMLAQAVVAAARSVDDDRVVHSLHAHFLRAGSVDAPVELAVERIRDGRSFSTRQVQVTQGGREIFRAILSFHVPEPGLDYSPADMPSVPPPEDVHATYSEFCRAVVPDEPWFGEARPMEILYINPPTAAEGVPVTESQKMWLRIPPRLPEDAPAHVAGLAYLSDATLVDHAVLPHGFRWHDPRLTGASLDHAMWFHAPTRADEWMLYDQRVEFTGGARGTASATLFTAHGAVVATCVQEGLMRWPS